MINIAEKSYSEAYLKKYRKIYPVIGWIGKPKNYNRFLINANAILHFDCFNDLKKITKMKKKILLSLFTFERVNKRELY